MVGSRPSLPPACPKHLPSEPCLQSLYTSQATHFSNFKWKELPHEATPEPKTKESPPSPDCLDPFPIFCSRPVAISIPLRTHIQTLIPQLCEWSRSGLVVSHLVPLSVLSTEALNEQTKETIYLLTQTLNRRSRAADTATQLSGCLMPDPQKHCWVSRSQPSVELGKFSNQLTFSNQF